LSDEAFWYDKDTADLAVRFFERLLVHSKGEWAGKPFILQEWQREDIIKPLFGWKRKSDNTRRYRTAYIEIPRKNGKSTLCAGLGLYLLFADGEPGAEIYSAAADKDQARIVFDEAKNMVEASPALSEYGKAYRNTIVVKSERNTYKVISADAYTKHGFNAHGIVFDELHAQPSRDLWDVLNTSVGARRQPLMLMITTAGVYDPESICWEQHEYARQVLDGVIDDPSFFAYIAAADDEDDWTSPVVWAKANPGLGETIKLDYLEGECRRAIASPAYQNTFRRLHLNQWTSQDERWLDMTAWNDCKRELPDLKGRTCFGGLDLASTTDIAAFVLCFPPNEEGEPYWLVPHFWIPSDNLIERVRRDRVPYDAWLRDGLIMATPGNVIDYYYIEQTIRQLAIDYDLQEIAFDRWGATLLYQRMEEARQTMIQFGQGFASMSPPMKQFLTLILSKQIAHDGNPVLRWMADNVVARQDPAGNIKPDKSRSKQKIDGIVAIIMGLDRALRFGGASVYDERGVIEL
jgi:phage terminase large subunit-like protein